jgi:hypothetical protein
MNLFLSFDFCLDDENSELEDANSEEEIIKQGVKKLKKLRKNSKFFK